MINSEQSPTRNFVEESIISNNSFRDEFHPDMSGWCESCKLLYCKQFHFGGGSNEY